MSDEVLFLHPRLEEADALRCIAFHDLVFIMNGPRLTLVGEGEDAWRRHIRVYQCSTGKVAVNYVRCGLTKHHYVELRGPSAASIRMYIISAHTAARLHLPVYMYDLVKAVDSLTDAYSKIDFATGLCMGSLTATPEVVAAWTRLLEDEEVRVAVAERLSYRTMPEIATLVETFAERETDPVRKPFLDQFARVYRTLVEIGPGDAALARFAGEELPPFPRQLLQIGAPGSRFYLPETEEDTTPGATFDPKGVYRVLYPHVTQGDFERAATVLGFLRFETRPGDEKRVAYEQVWAFPDRTTAVNYVESPLAGVHYFNLRGARVPHFTTELTRRVQARSPEELLASAVGPMPHDEYVKALNRMPDGEHIWALNRLAITFPAYDPAVFAIFEAYATKAPSPHLRRSAVNAMGFRLWPQFRPLLEQIIAEDPDESVREHAKAILAHVPAAPGGAA
jgi:hypothetical protein